MIAQQYCRPIQELTEQHKQMVGGHINDDSLISHLRWMCQQGQRFVEEGRIPKAMRWLGFVQGSMWRWYSIDKMRRVNAPYLEDPDDKR